MDRSALRRDFVTRPIYHMAKGVLPEMSDTEAEAIAAGDVWWDADLFSGDPDWQAMLAIPPAKLTEAERAFIDGPVDQLCAMLDDWKINWEDRDLPPEAWDFIKRERFFGMIIPEEFGGLGFSPYAHSEVVRKISTRSVAAAVTVMVPNSLGPGELLMKFGTDDQKSYWLPRLADGRDIPAFGLTSAEAGSDATAMTDTGVICEGEHKGQKVLGLKLNWAKRYITLGPIATVLGLAVKVKDPDGLLGGEEGGGLGPGLVLEIDVIALVGQFARGDLRHRTLRLQGAQDAEIVFGVLHVVFGQHPVAAGGRIAAELLIALIDRLGVAADLDVLRALGIPRPVRIAAVGVAGTAAGLSVAPALTLHALEISHIR